MATITIIVDNNTAEVTYSTTIKGKRCQAVHEAIVKDMLSLGGKVIESHDTPALHEVETEQQSARLTLRS